MGKHQDKHKKYATQPFVVEGQLAGMVFSKDGQRLKRLHLTTDWGGCSIKLPKDLDPIPLDALNLDDRLRIAGQKTLCYASGKIKLRAEQVMRLTAETCQQWGLNSLIVQTPAIGNPVSSPGSERHQESQGMTSTPTPPSSGPSVAPVTILLCGKSDCRKKGGYAVCHALKTTLQEKEWGDRVILKETGCMKRCKSGPNLVLMPGKMCYTHVSLANIPTILEVLQKGC